VYNTYRESFLADMPHIEMSTDMLSFVRSVSKDRDGLYVINSGDAICTIFEEDGRPFIAELIINPMLMDISFEIDMEIAARVAEKLGTDVINYRTPGKGYCQSMTAGLVARRGMGFDEDENNMIGVPYFGFPVD
jgi:hypothetical protein